MKINLNPITEWLSYPKTVNIGRENSFQINGIARAQPQEERQKEPQQSIINRIEIGRFWEEINTINWANNPSVELAKKQIIPKWKHMVMHFAKILEAAHLNRVLMVNCIAVVLYGEVAFENAMYDTTFVDFIEIAGINPIDWEL